MQMDGFGYHGVRNKRLLSTTALQMDDFGCHGVRKKKTFGAHGLQIGDLGYTGITNERLSSQMDDLSHLNVSNWRVFGRLRDTWSSH